MMKMYRFETRTGSGRLFILERRAASEKNAERAARQRCDKDGLAFVGRYRIPDKEPKNESEVEK